MNRLIRRTVMLAAASAFFMCGNILAEDLEPPRPPSDAGSAMYTLEDLYNIPTGRGHHRRRLQTSRIGPG